jgi:hypothetical protein
MLQIIFGYSKYYVDSLSENIRRGFRAKLERGWLPNKPPVGYKNEAEQRTIITDPETFPIMQRLFEKAVTGAYTVAELERMLREQWGFRTAKGKRSGARPLSVSSLYRVFSNPFFAGYIRWNGHLYPGKHQPAITWQEFERLQMILGRPGTEKPQKHVFAYTGLIRCGACGLMVTAEHKTNRFGSKYIYYHCTKRNAGERCSQPSIEVRELERQIAEQLLSIYVPPAMIERAIKALETQSPTGVQTVAAQSASLEKAIRECNGKLSTLVDLRLRGLISDQELVSRREETQKERVALAEELSALDRRAQWFEPVTAVISFGSRAADWFTAGNHVVRKMILKTIGSNLTLMNKKFSIKAAFPYSVRAEPASFLSLSRLVDDVRTRYVNRDPELLKLIQDLEAIEKMFPDDIKRAS